MSIYDTALQKLREQNPHAKAIDIGCGTGPKRPAPGYDRYCDVIPVRQGVQYPIPYTCCQMESMPFEDKEFDFARCHHVIEHTNDPDKACSELIRIAKAGILSFPPAQAEIQFGRRDHNWFVFVDHGRLLFIKKRYPAYGVPRAVTGCELNRDFVWSGSFKWVTVE